MPQNPKKTNRFPRSDIEEMQRGEHDNHKAVLIIGQTIRKAYILHGKQSGKMHVETALDCTGTCKLILLFPDMEPPIHTIDNYVQFWSSQKNSYVCGNAQVAMLRLPEVPSAYCVTVDIEIDPNDYYWN